MLEVFRRYQRLGRRVHVANPVCDHDVLTDRWPSTLRDQEVFIGELKHLVRQVERLMDGCDLNEMQKIMTELFGEAPTGEAFRSFNEKVGGMVRDGQSRHLTGTGRLVLPVAAATQSKATPRHTFYGAGDDDQ